MFVSSIKHLATGRRKAPNDIANANYDNMKRIRAPDNYISNQEIIIEFHFF